MSDKNQREGTYFYDQGDAETRAWFEKQWQRWPERVDQRLTTNLSFHYGGIRAYRDLNEGHNPPMSSELGACVARLDSYQEADQ